MTTRRTLLCHGSALALVPWVSAPAWAQATAAKSADYRLLVGQATRLSVLSDRVTRCQVQRALQVLSPRAERQLDDTQREVTAVMAELAAANLSPTTRRLQQEAAQSYNDFLKNSKTFDISKTDNLVGFAEQADVVGDKVDALVAALLTESGQAQAQLLAVSADLQRLTQHTAVHFLLASAGLQTAQQMKEVESARQVFGNKFENLQKAALKTPAIDNQLQLLGPQWLLMSAALAHPGRDNRTLENICTTSERLLEVTTALYRLYDAALKA